CARPSSSSGWAFDYW
nr:immunoglobulin heavy chain junction region [Macaca mulatta]MOY18113.1 immunoglobulin heavy chain junction region [Macaca mulatta]MOY18209.1 immunoglobulin heavy chain junction region [Macaca mulatta]MOY18258.1 immunoglobulin heavy chain junction region [Macaca mulatta]MOY18271.1 immunoglobulin heavy chain junction region [Macaca mulatta]